MWQINIVLLGFATLVLGAPKEIPSDRILGGNTTEYVNHRYIVTVLLNNRMWCIGALIGQNWVVTSAQCTDGIQTSSLLVRASGPNPNDGYIIDQVREVFQHSNYDPTYLDFDVSLLKLTSPLPPVDTGTIDLAYQTPSDGTEITVLGWKIPENGDLHEHILELQMPVVNHTRCEDIYLPAWRHITERMLCAGVAEVESKVEGICENDVGGPATADGKLVGIASWTVDCGNSKYPGVFTDIASVRDWIKSISGI